MDFKTLFEKISPRLKRVARNYNGHGFFIDKDDLYQEICIHLWNKFRDGVPDTINEAYIVRGCEFHILNYLRKQKEKARIVSLEEPLNEDGYALKDVLSDGKEPLDRCIDRKIIIDEIKNNGSTKREKEVLLLLLKGYTIREVGNLLSISHVMVIKYKKRLIKKYRKHIETDPLRVSCLDKRLPKRVISYF